MLYGKPDKKTIEKRKELKNNQKKNRFEWAEIIDLISKDMNMSWYEVTQMNIFAFKYRSDFILYKTKKQTSTIKKTRVKRS